MNYYAEKAINDIIYVMYVLYTGNGNYHRKVELKPLFTFRKEADAVNVFRMC
jgi:hypothetical protein